MRRRARILIVVLGAGILVAAVTALVVDMRRVITCDEQLYYIGMRLDALLAEEGAVGQISPVRLEALVKRLPEDKPLIVKDEQGAPVDPWGRRIFIEAVSSDGEHRLELRGAGRDGVMGSDDDATYSWPLPPRLSPLTVVVFSACSSDRQVYQYVLVGTRLLIRRVSLFPHRTTDWYQLARLPEDLERQLAIMMTRGGHEKPSTPNQPSAVLRMEIPYDSTRPIHKAYLAQEDLGVSEFLAGVRQACMRERNRIAVLPWWLAENTRIVENLDSTIRAVPGRSASN